MINCVVADVGPLIALAKLELLDLPCRTFGQLLVPRTVLDECLEQVFSRDAMLIGEAVNNVFPTPVDKLRWGIELVMKIPNIASRWSLYYALYYEILCEGSHHENAFGKAG